MNKICYRFIDIIWNGNAKETDNVYPRNKVFTIDLQRFDPTSSVIAKKWDPIWPATQRLEKHLYYEARRIFTVFRPRHNELVHIWKLLDAINRVLLWDSQKRYVQLIHLVKVCHSTSSEK